MFSPFPSVHSAAHAAIDSAFHQAALAEMREQPPHGSSSAGGWFGRLGQALSNWREAATGREIGRSLS